MLDESAICESECTAVLTLPGLDIKEGYDPDAMYELTIEGAAEYSLGDVDMDGNITIRDITLIQRALVSVAELDKVQIALADGDGQVTIQDATAVQLFIAEYNDGCEKTGEPFLYYQS